MSVRLWLDGCGPAEPFEVDDGLSAGHHLPVGNVRERLGQERSEDDDVESGDVRPDGAVVSSSLQDLLKSVVDLGPEGNGVLVERHGTAVQGKHEVGAMIDGLVDEATEAVDPHVLAVGGTVSCVQDEPEGPVRECRKQGFARWVAPVQRADADPGVRSDSGEWHSGAFSPYRRRGCSEHAVAVGRGVATQFASPGALAGCSFGFAHSLMTAAVDLLMAVQ